jgi:hypothetical protein
MLVIKLVNILPAPGEGPAADRLYAVVDLCRVPVAPSRLKTFRPPTSDLPTSDLPTSDLQTFRRTCYTPRSWP